MTEPQSRESKCTFCRNPGHYVTTCEAAKRDRAERRVADRRVLEQERDEATTRLEVVDESVEQVARMRAECDALATEIVEYEAVQMRVEQRLTENRRRVADLTVAIARMRRVK